MASFSNDVRAEICHTITDSDKKYACLYGIVLYCRHLTESSISVHTESDCFFELMCSLLKSIFGKDVVYDTEIVPKKNGCTGYYVNITDEKSVKTIFGTYNIDPEKREINLKNIVNNSLSAFLAGVFFVCGSISDPNKEYHLEFTPPTEQLYADLDQILQGFGISARKTERKNHTVLYVKDSENIEDILTFIGARQCTIDLINIKIYKDMRNKVNRIANCDTANIEKVINAASKQTRDIVTIQQAGYFDTLSADLKEAAQLRLDFPEYSLQEIGENLSKPIGRSGVNRRFQKIAALAEEIRGKDGENIGK